MNQIVSRDEVVIHQSNHYLNNPQSDEIGVALNHLPNLDMEKPPDSLGLLTGYAGKGMLQFTKINRSNWSWMLLL